MADPCIAPGDISHTYRGLSPFRGGWGGHSKLAPLFKGSLSETATVTPCVSRQVRVQNIGTTVPTKTPSMFLLQNGNIASTHYRTSSLVTSTCTSYSLKPTTIPLAPPLVEVNGEVLTFLHGWPIPVSPQEISPTLIVGYLPSAADWGYQGSSLRIFPAFLEGPTGEALRFFSSL